MSAHTILITGIGGLTPRSIASVLRDKFPAKRLIGIDSNFKAIGFFMDHLVDKYLIAPRATAEEYWHFIERVIESERVDMAFVQPESEVIEWGRYFQSHGRFPVKVMIPPLALAEVLVDKSKMSVLLQNTDFIPKTLVISHADPKIEQVAREIDFPCWIRATKGSGGLGSLRVENKNNLEAWLFLHKDIPAFTVSEYLPGRHLANQMLYYKGKFIKGAALQCAEYVMADAAPSGVTGNTSYGRMLNEDAILEFSRRCLKYIAGKVNVQPHGVFSFDLKEDKSGDLKVTEINVRHMAYTGVMANVGFDLISDTLALLNHSEQWIPRKGYHHYDKNYIFLRDVDIEPIVLTEEKIKQTYGYLQESR